MSNVIDWAQYFVSALVEICIWPFQSMSAWWGLTVVSIVSGVLLLLVYGRLSNQTRIKNIKRKIHAALLECILFRQNVKISLAAQGRLFWYALLYFLCALPPIIILALPCVLLLSQLNMRYGAEPLAPGQSALVSLKLQDADQLYRISLRTDPNLEVSPPLRVPVEDEVVWKITVKEPGPQKVAAVVDSNELFMRELGKPVTDIYASWWWRILYPDPSLKGPGQVISHAKVSYYPKEFQIFGVETSWIVIFLVLSILTGVIASKVLHIEI